MYAQALLYKQWLEVTIEAALLDCSIATCVGHVAADEETLNL